MQWGKMPFEDLYNLVYDKAGPVAAFMAVLVFSMIITVMVMTFYGCFCKLLEVALAWA